MIENYSFGKMTISGKTFSSDLKIIAGKIIPDWWRKSGHLVEESDIHDILAAAPDYLVIGKGNPGIMKVGVKLSKQLAASGISLIEEPTARAITTFNRLTGEGKNVAAGFHLTC
ncbi:MAG: hypothetical protein KQH63_01200 [Desulfobulbaceae bacterium]|nr:hypothetical protein [Desulfobulbaceae bacterium]